MLGLAVAVPAAHAEGSWTSYLSGVLTGYNSRTWTDNNTDSVTSSIRFDDCVNVNSGYPGTSATVQLTRETPWYQPDVNMGTADLACAVTATASFADEQAANYHFTVTKIGGSTSGGRLNASYVRVAY